MEPALPPTVSLDGEEVRRVREKKKLTQLYVAKVVGVTTDTISRWENNRTPSIKRENALKLAEALEVSLGEILEGGASAEPEEQVDDSPRRSRRYPWLLLLLAAGLGAALLLPRSKVEVHPAFEAERWLPAYAAPGNVIPVQVRFDAEAQNQGFIIREHFPPGWLLIEANPPASSLDNEGGTARWIVKPGKSPKRISYLIKVKSEVTAGSDGVFRGEVVAKAGSNAPFPVSGSSEVGVGPFLWADANGDGRVDDGEMLQASVLVEEMAGVHIDWANLEKIWDAGSYRWEESSNSFVPVRFNPEEPVDGQPEAPPAPPPDS